MKRIQKLLLIFNIYLFIYKCIKKINGGKNWALKLIDIPDHKYWLWDYAHNGAVVDQAMQLSFFFFFINLLKILINLYIY